MQRTSGSKAVFGELTLNIELEIDSVQYFMDITAGEVMVYRFIYYFVLPMWIVCPVVLPFLAIRYQAKGRIPASSPVVDSVIKSHVIVLGLMLLTTLVSAAIATHSLELRDWFSYFSTIPIGVYWGGYLFGWLFMSTLFFIAFDSSGAVSKTFQLYLSDMSHLQTVSKHLSDWFDWQASCIPCVSEGETHDHFPVEVADSTPAEYDRFQDGTATFS